MSVFQPWSGIKAVMIYIDKRDSVRGKQMNNDCISKTKKWDHMVYQQNRISKVKSVSENLKHMATIIFQ